MKNIHVLPTSQPSRLYTLNSSKKLYYTNNNLNQIKFTVNQNIYITSDEEIKGGDWILELKDNSVWTIQIQPNTNLSKYRKIILTTDQDLIKDGVQSIDDEFLEWFVKNPSCEFVEVENERIVIDDINYNFDVVDYKYKIIIPKEEPKQTDENGKPLTYWGGLAEHKQETLEEEPKQITSLDGDGLGGIPKGILTMLIGKKQETLEEAAVFKSHHSEEDFIRGGRWQQEQDKNRHSDEEVLELLVKMNEWPTTFNGEEEVKEWFEQFKKK